jgi:hypothetical protein
MSVRTRHVDATREEEMGKKAHLGLELASDLGLGLLLLLGLLRGRGGGISHRNIALRLSRPSPLRVLVEDDFPASTSRHALRRRQLVLVRPTLDVLLYPRTRSGAGSLIVRVFVDEHSSGVGVGLELGCFLPRLATA